MCLFFYYVSSYLRVLFVINLLPHSFVSKLLNEVIVKQSHLNNIRLTKDVIVELEFAYV